MSLRVPNRRAVRPHSSRLTGPARRVDLFLRSDPSVPDHRVHGVHGIRDEERQLLALAAGEVTEHEVRGVHPPRRPSDTDPEPAVVTGTQRAADRSKTVVAALASTELEHEITEREVELVVDD